MASRIYTRAGDGGDTGLFGGARVRKDDLRVEAYGSVDELNAVLGVARLATRASDPALDSVLGGLQHDLFSLGADLATPGDEDVSKGRSSVARVGPERAARLEEIIDRHEAELTPLTRFILPGGSPAAAHLHLARTVCRRAERRAVALAWHETVNPEALRYLNRLSDLLFVLARAANARLSVPDVPWEADRP